MQSRPLRDFEAGAHLHVLDWTHETARQRLQAAGEAQVSAAARAIVAGQTDGPPHLPSLEAAVHGELRKLYALGHATVRSELDHQATGEDLPVGLSAGPAAPVDLRALALADAQSDPGSLRARAALIASDVAHQIHQAVTRGRLLGVSTAAALKHLGREAGRQALRSGASHHAGAAISAGRRAAALGPQIHTANGPVEVIGARYTSVLDKNTCLGPDALVRTSGGEKRAADIGLGDELLTHAGRYMRPSAIIASEVQEKLIRVSAGGRTLALTADHPVLVAASDGFLWRPAGQLAVGDLVVSDVTLEGLSEARIVDHKLGHAPHGQSASAQIPGLAPIDVGAKAVPIAAIGLDHERTDEKVHDPRAYLCLGPVAQIEPFELFADEALDRGLAIRGAIAADRAVAASSTPGRDDTYLAPAVRATDEDRRPPTGFRTVAAQPCLSIPEGRSAASTDDVYSAVGETALAGAVGVARIVGNRNAELSPAADAGFGHSVGPALGRAVSTAPFEPVGEALAATLADGGRVLRSVLRSGLACQPPALFGRTALTARPVVADPLAAVDTPPIHNGIVCARVDAITTVAYCGPVYDFTIPEDHTFWAEGLLAHNCGPCAEADTGELLALDDPRLVHPPNPACEGGGRCRCLLVYQLRSEGVVTPTPTPVPVGEPVAVA